MSPHRPARIALKLLLAVMLVVTGVVAPVQAIADAFASMPAPASTQAATAQKMPCESMDRSEQGGPPCPCCAQHSCDLSNCLGTACLPELPRMAAARPLTTAPIAWRQSHVPVGVADAPLRPPIA